MNRLNGFGKCPSCNSWNTFYEEKIVPDSKFTKVNKIQAKPIKLEELKVENKERTLTGFEELDRVLGGGLVKGSLLLLRW